MRVVVADATPLHYLILVDAVEILPRLFGHLYIPAEVREELTRAATPTAVREWIEHGPTWLEVVFSPRDAALLSAELRGLHSGEQQAIALAEFLRADLLLIDERAGAEIAQRRGLSVTGTLGILDLASRSGFVELREVFGKLQKTNFRYPPSVMERLIEEERERRS
jgi:predicted nucleic acid-binding protein